MYKMTMYAKNWYTCRTIDQGSWCRAAALVPRIMDHTAWILVPGSSWTWCNNHLVPRIMDLFGP